MIPESEWKWFGYAGHLIVAEDCYFHLTTQVGDYLVSTIGAWVPSHRRERSNNKYEEIGVGRLFETAVFKAGEICNIKECNCKMPSIDGHELCMYGSNDAGTAAENHRKVCLEVAQGLVKEWDYGI